MDKNIKKFSKKKHYFPNEFFYFSSKVDEKIIMYHYVRNYSQNSPFLIFYI